jgi:hypothetical protein
VGRTKNVWRSDASNWIVETFSAFDQTQTSLVLLLLLLLVEDKMVATARRPLGSGKACLS